MEEGTRTLCAGDHPGPNYMQNPGELQRAWLIKQAILGDSLEARLVVRKEKSQPGTWSVLAIGQWSEAEEPGCVEMSWSALEASREKDTDFLVGMWAVTRIVNSVDFEEGRWLKDMLVGVPRWPSR